MYPDPKRVRDNRLMVRFDDYEYVLITALANYQGAAAATLICQMVLREAAEARIPACNVARECG